jgi:hypothetical protein
MFLMRKRQGRATTGDDCDTDTDTDFDFDFDFDTDPDNPSFISDHPKSAVLFPGVQGFHSPLCGSLGQAGISLLRRCRGLSPAAIHALSLQDNWKPCVNALIVLRCANASDRIGAHQFQ